MADAVVDKVIVELTARLGRYNADVLNSRALFDRSVGGMAQSAGRAERQIAASSASIKTALLGTASAIAAGFSVQAVTGLADSYTRFTNQLKLAGLEGTNLGTVQEKLFQSAQKYGVELESLGTLYGRVAQAGKDLGASQEDLLKFTNGVAAAIKVQGSSTESAKGALLQLSQALGGAIVRAEEYNSINEGARPILQAVANGSDRFKGSVNALRAAVIDGKVSSQEFYQAFLDGSSKLEAQATKANLTIAASLTTLNNALGVYVGQTDASLSATQRISQAIEALANNLDTIIPALGILIGLVGARYVGALGAATAATVSKAMADALGAQNALAHAAAVNVQVAANTRLVASGGAATAALRFQAASSLTAAGASRAFGGALLGMAGGPIGVALIAIGALTAGIIYLSNKYGENNVLQRELAGSAETSGKALDEYEQAAIKAANATGANAVAARANAAAMRQEALDAVRSAEALRERTAALAASTALTARAEADDIKTSVGQGQTTLNQGQYATAKLRAEQAEAAAMTAQADFVSAAKRYVEIEANLKDGSYVAAPVSAATTTPKKGPKGKSAEELERERLRIERRFADDLRDANRDLLDARGARARTEQELLAEEIRRIGQTRDDAISEAAERGPNGTKEYTEARVAQLNALYRQTAGIEIATAIQNTANRLFEDAQEIEANRFDMKRDALDADLDLARTSAARAELERQILELGFQQERAQLAAVIAAQDSTDVERQIAQERMAFLPQLQAAQREALRRASLTPLERLGTAETGEAARGPQQRREIIETAAADGLDGLASSLARATLEAEGFGAALLAGASSIVEGVLTEVYQSIIVAPLADLMKQGLDSLFGTATTAAKTSSDLQAATATTALATTSATAATALGTVTLAAGVLQQALLAAAATAGGKAGGDIASTIMSAFGSGGARAIGGNVSQNLPVLVGENGPEVFWPRASGVISPSMPAPAQERRGGGGGNVQIVNNTGVPASVLVERDDETGNQKLTLEPLGSQMIEGAGRSGKLRRAMALSPQAKKRA